MRQMMVREPLFERGRGIQTCHIYPSKKLIKFNYLKIRTDSAESGALEKNRCGDRKFGDIGEGEVKRFCAKLLVVRDYPLARRRTQRVWSHRTVAEGAGFEPALRFPANTLSRRAPSATRPPLQPAKPDRSQLSQGRQARSKTIRPLDARTIMRSCARATLSLPSWAVGGQKERTQKTRGRQLRIEAEPVCRRLNRDGNSIATASDYGRRGSFFRHRFRFHHS